MAARGEEEVFMGGGGGAFFDVTSFFCTDEPAGIRDSSTLEFEPTPPFLPSSAFTTAAPLFPPSSPPFPTAFSPLTVPPSAGALLPTTATPAVLPPTDGRLPSPNDPPDDCGFSPTAATGRVGADNGFSEPMMTDPDTVFADCAPVLEPDGPADDERATELTIPRPREVLFPSPTDEVNGLAADRVTGFVFWTGPRDCRAPGTPILDRVLLAGVGREAPALSDCLEPFLTKEVVDFRTATAGLRFASSDSLARLSAAILLFTSGIALRVASFRD